MDTKSLYYFLELAKDLHYTNTAERLYMSQQTLSNHIHRLEEELGTPLITSKPHSKELTPSGKLLLEFAQQTRLGEKNLKNKVKDIAEEARGIISFGASNLRMNVVIPEILPKFSKKYPLVQINLLAAESIELEKAMLAGELDLAIVISNMVNSILEEEIIFQDQIYLCVNDTLLDKIFGSDKQAIIDRSIFGVNIKDFSDVPFCLLDNKMGKVIDSVFFKENVSPKVYTKCGSLQISTAIGMQGNAAFFATRTSLVMQKENTKDKIYVFPFYQHDHPLAQSLSIVNPRNQYQPSYLRYFKSLLIEYLQNIEYTPFISH
ncbi:LysR family transcriptional regulator [Streptococcus orisasini]